MARCFLDNACLDQILDICFENGVYVKNMIFHSAIEKTPFEVMFNEKTNLSFLKLFGCVAFMHIEKPIRTRIRSKLKRRNFLGTLITVSDI